MKSSLLTLGEVLGKEKGFNGKGRITVTLALALERAICVVHCIALCSR